jgi:TetR/AcrR family transcriptional repressor of nem operon
LCEFGLQDGEVLQALQGQGNARVQRRLLLANLRRAKVTGDLRKDANINALAGFFDTTLAGLRIAARGGTARAELSQIIEIACRAFQ